MTAVQPTRTFIQIYMKKLKKRKRNPSSYSHAKSRLQTFSNGPDVMMLIQKPDNLSKCDVYDTGMLGSDKEKESV